MFTDSTAGMFSVMDTCRCILIMAFPMRVAPKNVENGMRKWPQVMPARSNRGLGNCMFVCV